MQQSEQFFSNKQLKRMIIPLFIEQTRHLVIWLVLIHNIANAVVFHLRILWEKDYVLPEMYDLPRVFPFLQPLACDSFYLYSLVSGAILA